jgi:hypothetical protein
VAVHIMPGELARVFELLSYQSTAQTLLARIVGAGPRRVTGAG